MVLGSVNTNHNHNPKHIYNPNQNQRHITLNLIGVRANIHLGDQTEFCPNGEHKLFVNNNELLQCLFFDDHIVLPDERLLCYPIETYLR